ncbi:MAG: TetR/AcrR family transcriptional regulator [Oscillospiraceae bacterium]|nr:TetR/AcrR family transcriptional regulator [Oscillospiraceae bacterium]
MSQLRGNKERIIKTATKLFIENGYEKTSIQDILDDLGDITKGSIYHHFESKEDIFNAVALEIGGNNKILFNDVRDDVKLTGVEKLRSILLCSVNSKNTSQLINMTPNYFENPKFLIAMLNQIQEVSIPQYILPIIEMGIEDETIQTKSPNELAELIMILLNLWINPLLFGGTECSLKVKCDMINNILKQYGFILFDEEIMSNIAQYK